MSEIKYKKFPLTELFSIERGNSKYTKSFANQHRGEFPIYSASNISPLATVNLYDFNGEYLTWATNGFAGYMKVISGKFSINGDRGLLKPLSDDIDIHYVRYVLEPNLREIAKGRKGEKGVDEFTKVYPSMIEKLLIQMPVNDKGEIDHSLQGVLLGNFNYVEQAKQKVKDYIKLIDEVDIRLEKGYKHKVMTVNDLFDDVSGFTFKKDLFTYNKSDIPIIRIQNLSEKKSKFVYYPKSIKIDKKFEVQAGDYLLPLSGSYFKLTKWIQGGNFYLNQRIAKLSLKGQFREAIYNNYLQTILNLIEKEIFKLGYSGNNNIRIGDVRNITIQIPITSDGKFDLQAQIEIVKKYAKMEVIRKEAIADLSKLLYLEVSIV